MWRIGFWVLAGSEYVRVFINTFNTYAAQRKHSQAIVFRESISCLPVSASRTQLVLYGFRYREWSCRHLIEMSHQREALNEGCT